MGRFEFNSIITIFHLLVVLFLVDHNVSINEQIIEEEKLPILGNINCELHGTNTSKTDLHLGFGFFLHAFVKTPSPTKTRPEGKLLRKHLKIKTLKDCPYLVRQGVVLRCQSNLLPGQFVEHWPQNSLHTNLSLFHVSIHSFEYCYI